MSNYESMIFSSAAQTMLGNTPNMLKIFDFCSNIKVFKATEQLQVQVQKFFEVVFRNSQKGGFLTPKLYSEYAPEQLCKYNFPVNMAIIISLSN